MTTWTPAIQYIDGYQNEQAAREALSFLKIQVDFLAGRVLPATEVEPTWRVQAIFEGNGGELPLPDGCRHVLWRGRL